MLAEDSQERLGLAESLSAVLVPTLMQWINDDPSVDVISLTAVVSAHPVNAARLLMQAAL